MLPKFLWGITSLLWGVFRIPPPKEEPTNVSVQKPPGPKAADCDRGFCTAKSAVGALLLALFGFSPAVVQAAADLKVTMLSILQIDGDVALETNPGDTVRYQIDIENIGDAADTSVTFAITPDAKTTLDVGSVTTDLGAVTTGNNAGDTTVNVNVGSVLNGTTVTIKFDVVLNSNLSSCETSISTQGTVTSASGTKVTDDINNAATDEATVRGIVVYNNAPTSSNNTVSTYENTQKVFASSDFPFTDLDNSCGDSLSKVQITGLESAGDLYYDANDNGALDGGEDITADQEIEVANILRLKFQPVANVSGAAHSTFQFRVHDGTDYSTSEHIMTIDVDANNAPTSADSTVAATEDTPFTFTDTDFPYTDTNTPADLFTSIEITQLESAGELKYSGADVTLNQVILVADIPNLTFTPAADANGTGYANFQFTVNDGKTDSLSAYTMTVNVTATADDPTGTDGTITATEDGSYTLVEADFGFNDADGDTLASVKITTLETAAKGALQLSGGDVTADQVIPVADITAGNLTYAPVADGFGTSYDTFQFTVIDSTAADSSSANTMTINVTGQPDNPTAADGTVTATEDTAYSFVESDFGFSDLDNDTLGSVKITSLATAGEIKLSGTAVSANDTVGLADITAGNLTFTPAADASGVGYAAFQFTVIDSTTAESSPANTITINVDPANDAPTAADGTVTVNEDNTHTFAAGEFNFADGDGDTLASVKITSLETLGDLDLSGTDVALDDVISKADIDAGNLTFAPALNGNGTGYATFQFTVNDGTTDSLSAYTMTINVTAVDDPPTAADKTVTTDEDVNYTFSAADFGYSDVDGDALASVTVTTAPTTGTLKHNGTAVNDGDTVPAADIVAFLLIFEPVAGASGTNYASFQFTVNDGTSDSSSANTITINVNPVNDPPTAANNTVTIDEDTDKVFAAADFNFSDTDGGSLSQIQITVIPTVGTLFVDANANSVVDTGETVSAGDVVLLGNIPNLTFQPVAGDNGGGYANFQFKVHDGTDYSLAAYTMTINVTAQPSDPTAADNTLTVNEDATLTFAVADFGFADADGDTQVSVTITTAPTAGTLQNSGTAVNDGDVITVADINAGNLTFAPAADANGAGYTTFPFTVTDSTGASSASATMTINVDAQPDNPTAANNTVTTNEDVTYTFAAADFGFSDVDTGDTLASVKIIIPETAGDLEVSGADVAANQTVGIADITAGNMTFTPATNANGTAYDTFDFTVIDNTGLESASYTMTINVTAINDPPEAINGTITIDEDTTHTFAVGDFGYSDAESDPFTSVEIITSVTVGTLQRSGTDVSPNEIIPVANVPDLVFTPLAGESGTGYDSFQFTVNDGTQDSDTTYTMTIDVTAVNDAPTAADFTITIDEDASNTFAEADFGFSDVDGDSFVSMEITQLPVLGSLELSSVAVTPNQVILVADIPNLVYAPAANGSGTGYDNFQYTVNDGTVDSSPANTVTIDVNAINDAPSFNGSLDNTPTFVEDSSAVVLDSDATISDPELDAANNYDGATLTLVRTGTANVDDAFSETGTLSILTEGDPLTVSGVGIGTVTTNSGGTLLLTFDTNATSVLVNSVLQQIAYSNSNDGPPASVTIDYTINDGNVAPAQGTGTALEETGSITVTIIGVNDAPINAVPGTQTINEDNTLTFSSSNVPSNVISISDVDAGANDVKVYLTADMGTLTLNGTPPFASLDFLIGDGADDASMTFTGTMTDINTALDGMVFTPNADFNGTAGACDGTVACVQIVTNDLGNTGGGSAAVDDQSVLITINAINDDPVFTSTPVTAVDEDVAYSYSIVTSDVDGDALTITDLTIPAWLSSFTDNGDGTATLSGTPVEADVGTHNVTLQVSDGIAPAVDQTFTITVNAVNDAPVNSVPGAQTMDEDTTLTFTGANLISISDDAGTNPVQVTLKATSALTLSSVTGLNFTVGDDTLGALNTDMTFTGTTTAINTALDGMVYTPTADYNGAGSVQIVTNDQGYTGGGALSDDDTVSITITAVNDAPMFTSTPAVTTVDEDSAFSYSVVTTDVDFDAVTITDPTTATWLTLVDNGDGTGTLSGIPTNDDVGTHNVTLQVSDGIAPAVDQTFTITVNNTNDAPVFTSTALTAVDEDSAYSYTVTATDVDVGDTLTITAQTTLPSWLSLTTGGGSTETLSGTPTNADVGDHTVTLRVSDVGGLFEDQTFTITVANVNDAPVLDSNKDKDGKVANLSLSAIAEDAGAPSGAVGTLISDLVALGGNVTDVDSGAVTGVALTGALTTDGSWHYTLDGGTTWIAVASVADNNALLLAADANTRLYFEPNADFNGTITDAITLRAWDQTSGTAGTQVDASVNGGTTAFSSATDTASLTVNAVNDDPVFTSTAVTTVNEDDAYSYSVVASDVDVGDTLTITAPTIPGWLSLTTGGGGTETLSGTPTNSEVGTHNVTLRVNDGNVDVDQSFTITVANVNDAPVLDNNVDSQGSTANISLTAIDEDAATPFGPVGTLISNLVALAGNVTDVDGSAVTGVALTAVLADNGSWHYTLDGGTNWTAVGSVADNNALLLAADTNTRLYLQPNADFNGDIIDAITLRAWDQSSGTAGTQVDTSTNGGTTAFSSATDTANLTITAVNDAPVNTVPGAQTIDEDTALAFTGASLISISDDAGVNPVQVTLTAINGTLTLNGTTDLTFSTGTGSAEASMVFTGTMTDINTALDGMNFNPNANYNGPATVQIVTDDQGHVGSGGALSDDDTVSITVNPVNDPPIFTSGAVTFVDEDSAYGYSVATSDVDVGDTLALSAPTLPSWMNFSDNGNGAGTLSGTPTNSEVGTHDVTLRVSDGTVEVDQVFVVTVINTNDAPEFTSTAVTSVNEDSAYSYSITTSDVDAGDTLTLIAPTAPNWVSLTDNGDGTGTLSGTPVKSDVGIHQVTLQVSDGSVTVDQSFTVTVINVNEAPVFTSVPVTAVDVDSVYTYSVVVNDPDGDALTLSATVPSWVTFADNGDGTGTLSGTATEAVLGTHEVVLQASDSVLQAQQSFTVTVSIPNKAPVNTVPEAQNVVQDASLVFSTANNNLIAISDEDAGDNAVQVAITATNITCTLSGTTGLTFAAGDGTDDAIMVFTGTIADINAALEGMRCSPTVGFSGDASVQIVTDDQGNTGSGGPKTDDDTVVINVSALPLELTLTVDPASFSEALGTPSTIATVSRLDMSGVLTVTLESSDESEATVPTTVVIPDTQKSVSFSVTAVDDTEVDGTQTVVLTASAPGYESATATVSVIDNEEEPSPDLMTLILTVEGDGTVTGPGIECPTDCSDAYNSNTQITLTATPVAGGQFVGWEGDCDSSNNVLTVTMADDKQCTAKFTQVQFALTVEKAGEGTITSDPTGIDCGDNCVADYNNGTEVTLIATPETGWLFEAWDADLCDIETVTLEGTEGTGAGKVTMTADQECKANFAREQFTLTVEIVGKGTVTSDPAGIDCGEECSKAYGSGTEVTLTATPEVGWQFDGWKGEQCDVDSTGKVTLTTDQDCEAHFVEGSCEPNGVRIDASDHLLEDNSCFTSSVSTGGKEQPNNVMLTHSEATAINISGTITADPEDVGKSADIIVVVIYDVLQYSIAFARDGQGWAIWDRRIGSLPSAETVTLSETAISVPVIEGDLSVLPGKFTVYLAYRLANGTLHLNGVDPLRFSVGNAASVDMDKHSELCFTCNDAQATDHFHGFVRNKGQVGNNLTFTDNGVFEIASLVGVDSRHVGLPADIFVTVTYEGAEFMRNGNGWLPWDGQLASLTTAESLAELTETLEITAYKGPLKGVLGEFIITVGYRLDDGTLVFSMDPIHFIVE